MGMTQGLLASLVAAAVPADRRGTAFGVFNLAGGVALLLAEQVLAGAPVAVVRPGVRPSWLVPRSRWSGLIERGDASHRRDPHERCPQPSTIDKQE